MATFGNTNVEASDWSCHMDTGKWGYRCQLTEAGTVSKISAYIANTNVGHVATNAKAVIYLDNGSTQPGTVKGASNAVAIADSLAYQWVDFTFSPGISLTADWYWIGLFGEGSSAVGVLVKYLSTGGNADYAAGTYANAATEDWGGSHTARTYVVSVYATYDTGAAFSGLTVTHYITG